MNPKEIFRNQKMQKISKTKEEEQIKSLIASDQEANLLLAIHIAQANEMSLESLAKMIYYEAARKMTSCHGYPPSTIYDIKFYFSFSQEKYGLSFSVEGIPVEGEDFVHDFDELLQIGGTSYSLDTQGLESEISINQSQEAFDLTQVQVILCQLLEEYLKDEG